MERGLEHGSGWVPEVFGCQGSAQGRKGNSTWSPLRGPHEDSQVLGQESLHCSLPGALFYSLWMLAIDGITREAVDGMRQGQFLGMTA